MVNQHFFYLLFLEIKIYGLTYSYYAQDLKFPWKWAKVHGWFLCRLCVTENHVLRLQPALVSESSGKFSSDGRGVFTRWDIYPCRKDYNLRYLGVGRGVFTKPNIYPVGKGSIFTRWDIYPCRIGEHLHVRYVPM